MVTAAKKTTARKTTAKAAAPRKAAPRKVAPRKATPAPAPQVVEAEDQAATELAELQAKAAEEQAQIKTGVVPFRGRDIQVKMPAPEQLAVFQRVATRLSGVESENLSGEQVIKLYNRALSIITTVMVDPADVEWLEDQLLDGGLTLVDCLPLVIDAVKKVREVNSEDDNRASRRAAAKKARRTR